MYVFMYNYILSLGYFRSIPFPAAVKLRGHRSPPLLALTAAASCAAQSLQLLKEAQSERNRRQIDVVAWKLVKG